MKTEYLQYTFDKANKLVLSSLLNYCKLSALHSVPNNYINNNLQKRPLFEVIMNRITNKDFLCLCLKNHNPMSKSNTKM